jgi:hypothetical protein
MGMAPDSILNALRNDLKPAWDAGFKSKTYSYKAYKSQ